MSKEDGFPRPSEKASSLALRAFLPCFPKGDAHSVAFDGFPKKSPKRTERDSVLFEKTRRFLKEDGKYSV
jgi:hypothetical protein